MSFSPHPPPTTQTHLNERKRRINRIYMRHRIDRSGMNIYYCYLAKKSTDPKRKKTHRGWLRLKIMDIKQCFGYL
jgi:hypothetical protein